LKPNRRLAARVIAPLMIPECPNDCWSARQAKRPVERFNRSYRKAVLDRYGFETRRPQSVTTRGDTGRHELLII
jgi:hypothetical protein